MATRTTTTHICDRCGAESEGTAGRDFAAGYAEQAISARRVQSLLDNGAQEGRPDYWYGVTSEDGALWGELFAHRSEAAKLAEDLRGQVVIVVARILENEDGEQIEPEN